LSGLEQDQEQPLAKAIVQTLKREFADLLKEVTIFWIKGMFNWWLHIACDHTITYEDAKNEPLLFLKIC